MRILVFSTFYGLPDFTSLSIRNHLAYSIRHEYTYIPDFLEKPTSRQFSWAKILLGMRHLQAGSYDAIFWMDADSLFFNQEVRIEDLLDSSPAPIHFTGDENDIFNGGHILLRSHPKSIEFLQECWKVCEINDHRIVTTHKDEKHLYDQPGILAVLGGADPDDSSTWATGFNAVNGFPENPFRIQKDFQQVYAPSDPQNCKAALSLICDKWRQYCYIHPQRVMNSYPWFMGAEDFIVHFVGNTKHLMTDWREHFQFYPS